MIKIQICSRAIRAFNRCDIVCVLLNRVHGIHGVSLADIMRKKINTDDLKLTAASLLVVSSLCRTCGLRI